jgi:hypothetical protein
MRIEERGKHGVMALSIPVLFFFLSYSRMAEGTIIPDGK